jgi:hypothetical protein
MTPAQRKLSTTAHITFSVGWLGAVAAFVALSVAGLTSQRSEIVRAVYVSMNVIGLAVIVPLALASLITGLIEGLASQWGLFRHYWVLIKLLLTVLATGLLLLHQFTVVARAAARVLGPSAGALTTAGRDGVQLVVDASLGLLVLLVATTLSVYKPQGLTSYGLRRLLERNPNQASRPLSRIGSRIFVAVVATIAFLFVVLHAAGIAGHGHGSHGQ